MRLFLVLLIVVSSLIGCKKEERILPKTGEQAVQAEAKDGDK